MHRNNKFFKVKVLIQNDLLRKYGKVIKYIEFDFPVAD